MTALEKETAITAYFNMWVQREFSKLDTIFAKNIYYSECYGPEYYGLSEIYQWIEAMLQKQKVLEWRIKKFFHENDSVIVEWFFREQQSSIIHGFDGISIIEFQSDRKIHSIKEFESKSDHISPYH
ncbi:nuclear transport factor 2 family protein [Oscillibacter ruminantium]|uniref:nuclear transport factor 2 family protein n=1 Tax=Oscillibacter ruminantium TaxID=1263547 RepID=UPI00331F5C89